MPLATHPRDSVVDGAVIRSGHVPSDVQEAADAYYRRLSTGELSAVAAWCCRQLDTNSKQMIWLAANDIITLCAVYSEE